jgi:hypothetical protein
VSGTTAVALGLSVLSGCYYVGPYPYGSYGAAPYPAAYATQGTAQGTQDVAQGDESNNPYVAPAGPDDQAASSQFDPNAQQAPQAPPPDAAYAPAPVVAAPAYYPVYPAYPAYYPPYGYGGPGWWGPGVSLNFGFYGHYGHYGHHH